MKISKPFEWDWESRETAQDIRFSQREYPSEEGGLLITRKDKRGRVDLYKTFYFAERRQSEAQFSPSDHGGARGARRAAMQWIKYRHWETSGKRIINAMKEYQRSKGL